MNQDYRGRVKRHLEAGGDPKYVNVRKKSAARRESSHSKALTQKVRKSKQSMEDDSIKENFVNKVLRGI